MRYLPHTKEDIATMLKVVGADDLEGLFSIIPENCCQINDINLPEPLTEWELDSTMDEIAGSIAVSPEYKVYIGAGSYEHYVPQAASYVLSRSEFVTSYTPYQPEISQGTLQAIYEYQTLTSGLLGMDVANASMYDGASALAEAILMASRVTKRKKIALSRLIHPLYRQVVRTYLEPADFEIIELPYLKNGTTDISSLEGLDDLGAVAIQSPNFFGCVEDLKTAGEKAHGNKSLLVASFTEPLAFGLLKNPGNQGADIACGEGQSMGIPRSFGGPGLGMFASNTKYVRNMPGRLIGKTTDKDGKDGFVLTLATREQHIRRDKATSNICTNSGLCATASAMYMAFVGGTGLRELAQLNHDKASYLKSELEKAGFTAPFNSPFFNEFVIKAPGGFDSTYKKLLDKKIVAGLPLATYYPELTDHYLFCVTETRSREDMDNIVREVKS